MNCQDIAAILNERDIGALGAAERRAADRHLAECHQCAREWAMHERLIASPVPPMPGRLGQRLHEIVLSAARPGRPRRAGGRPMLVAGLMLLGAAAAALVGADFFGADNGEPDADPIASIAIEAPAVTSDASARAPDAVPATPRASAPSTAMRAADTEADAAAGGFTVAVSPLVQAAESSSVAAITETIYREMIDALRALPNLTLIEIESPIAIPVPGAWHPSFVAAADGALPDTVALEEIASERDAAGNRVVFELEPVFSFPAAEAASGAADNLVFEEAFIGGAISSRTVLEGATAAASSVVDIVTRGGVTESVRIDLPLPAAGAGVAGSPEYDYVIHATSSARNDPATGAPRSFEFNLTGSAVGGNGGTFSFGIGADLYESYDPSAMARQVVTQLTKFLFQPTEATIEAVQSQVLDQTAPIDERLGALAELRMIALRSGTDGRVSELVPAIIDMAVEATGAGQRAWIWELIRGSADRRLVAPLVDSLLYDADAMVRLEAAKSLVTFPDDPTAVAALEQAGRFDASEDVSLFASWSTMTEAEHRDRVASALLDTSLTDAERIAPLSFAARYPYGVGGAELVSGMDAEATAELVAIVERTAEAAVRADLMQHLAGVDRADVVDFFVGRLETDTSELVRSIAAHSLRQHADRPGVRAALENARIDDASPVVRDLAAVALGAGANTVPLGAGAN